MVAAMTSTPDRWDAALVRDGFVDPRYKDDRPSRSRLAEKVGVHTTTISHMITGKRSTDPATVAAVADALGVDVVEVSRWVNQARSQAKPYKVPAQVDLLTQRQQDALTELILAMAAGRREDGGEHDVRSASTSTDPRVTRSNVVISDPEGEDGQQRPPPRGQARKG